ncbi:MAG: M3 family oligoendopeptidase [Candidatus Eisenbacteria bacterium]|nr:M3 family oligoendopeptidase [Candidatus Eisenbacteria bacterium]
METVSGTVEEREASLAASIERLVAELSPLQRAHHEALWLANLTGQNEHEEACAHLDLKVRLMFSRSEPYRFLLDLRAAGGVSDPTLARQLDLLIHSYHAHQIPPAAIERMVRIEKSLESRFNNFRAEFRGRRVGDNEIRQVLQNSDDEAERREAWEASKQIGVEVAGDLRELVRVRNAAARDLGFENFYAMSLALDELDEAELFALLEDLERGTRPLFDAYRSELEPRLARRFGIAVDRLQPWHLRDPFFQEAPPAAVDLDPYFAAKSLEEITARFFTAIGLDICDVLERADLYEKPGKSQHAFCLHVDRGADIRVLCNLRPNEAWMSTMLHEFGHAAYDKFLDPGLPWLLRSHAHTLTTEASAMLFGRLSKNAAWLERHADVAAAQARPVGEACARAIREQLLVQTRWCLVMCTMERALYRDPGQDLDTLWWDLVERFQGVRRPEGRRAPDWASKIHFSVAPVYYQNYVLGEMMASQLQRHLLVNVVGGDDPWPRYVSSPAVGEFLIRELYRSGRSTDWRATILRATGAPLSVSAFVDELAGRV